MDSGATTSPPQAPGVGPPNTSKFRFSELLTSTSHERPRTSSLKGKQVQQEPPRESCIYGLYYAHPAAVVLTPTNRSPGWEPCFHVHAYP